MNNDNNKEQCPTCHGRKQVMISCCTGEIVDDDIAMCPSCHEHLGDEDCPECDGTGEVPADHEQTQTVVPGLQQISENLMDRQKEQL